MPAKKSDTTVPAPLERSEQHAQDTFVEAHDSAAHVHGHEGDEGYAHRVAYAAVKHTYEKVGDHWEPKDEPGPSDARAESGGPHPTGSSAGGVDANATKAHLQQLAKRQGIPGRSRMTKGELVAALQRDSRRKDAAARS